MPNENRDAVLEVLKTINYFIDQVKKSVLQNYTGIILSQAQGNKWNVQFNGEVHVLDFYGDITPEVGKMVKVFIPEGNMSLAYFI